MTLKDRVSDAITTATRGHARLARRVNRGRLVWAAVCRSHHIGVHRYTLTDGSAVWGYWSTLAEAEVALACK